MADSSNNRTRQDLLFIRRLKEEGFNVKSNPELDVKMLSHAERQLLLQSQEADQYQVDRKKGPREQLNPIQFAKE